MPSERTPQRRKYPVGEVRPSQLLFTYGVGSLVDLPHLSTLVMGLDEWDTTYSTEITEERLLNAATSHFSAPACNRTVGTRLIAFQV